MSVFVPVIAIAEYTPSEHLFLTLRGRFGGLLHFLVFPESFELVGRPWLASVWFLKAQEGLSTSRILPLVLVHVISAFLRPARGNQRPGFK